MEWFTIIKRNPETFSKPCVQLRYKSRGCNVAECGGSTTVCTSTQTTSESCNTGCCRKFYNQTIHDRQSLKSNFRRKYQILNSLISFKPSLLLGTVGAPGAVAAKHVEVGWDLYFTLLNILDLTSQSWVRKDFLDVCPKKFSGMERFRKSSVFHGFPCPYTKKSIGLLYRQFRSPRPSQ